MEMERAIVTVDRLRELLSYDPETGDLRWLVNRRGGGARVGAVAGSDCSRRYRVITIDQVSYPAHVLAFVLMEGRWPADQLDHRDRNGLNNRWLNLREATPSQNNQNKSISKNNTSGAKGVSFCRTTKKWQVKITVDRKQRFLGRYDRFDVAVRVRADAEVRLHPYRVGA